MGCIETQVERDIENREISSSIKTKGVFEYLNNSRCKLNKSQSRT